MNSIVLQKPGTEGKYGVRNAKENSEQGLISEIKENFTKKANEERKPISDIGKGRLGKKISLDPELIIAPDILKSIRRMRRL